MPLAWVISDQPRAEATLALIRMATRDKRREARIYECEGAAIDGVGIGYVKHDNGPGLRNAIAVSALLGIEAMDQTSRTYAATDKPYIERMFGTIESVLLKLIHGYTGRKAGELPGYDAIKNGVLNIEELNKILTRFMIDEYPRRKHYGVGIGARRPIDVYNHINSTRGCFAIDPDKRRIHLGWKQMATPTDEGVRVFGGIWFNSGELQEMREDPAFKGRKVAVYVDPDNMNLATVVIPGLREPTCVQIQITAFADMTLPEILELMAAWRKKDPKSAVIHEDRIMRLRRERFDVLRAIGVERKLNRSYSTVEECIRKTNAVFAGARVVRAGTLEGTTAPGAIEDLTGPHVIQLGGSMVLDGIAEEVPFDNVFGAMADQQLGNHLDDGDTPQTLKVSKKASKKSQPKSAVLKPPAPVFGRPAIIKDLE